MNSVASSNSYESRHTHSDRPLRSDKTFCGLQPLWVKLDRCYKFYITPEAIYAGWIGGQFYDSISTRCQLVALCWFPFGFVVVDSIAKWADNRRHRLEANYDMLIADREKFLAADDCNLEITRTSLSSITASSRKTHWTSRTNSGILTFDRIGEDALKIIVGSSHPMNEVINDLIAAGYPVETE